MGMSSLCRLQLASPAVKEREFRGLGQQLMMVRGGNRMQLLNLNELVPKVTKDL